jgi:dTDP-L-rhamnose 4-epimerase
MKILITGGAGFIGRHLVENLASSGAEIVVLDSLTAQIHGPNADFPPELAASRACKCVHGDVCDRETISKLLADVDAVVHLAAETGTGQSMYEILRYERTNVQGTATILDVVANERPRRLRKLLVASSRAVYGEGKYRCAAHGIVYPRSRSAETLNAGKFEPECPQCAGGISLLPTSEDTPFAPCSFYGLTKQIQEQMTMMLGATGGLSVIALRYQNVYGPGQSLSNPYTGLLAVFANRVRQGKPLNVFEDGRESRDFVHVSDVIAATSACLAREVHGMHAVNVGSGVATPVAEVARLVRAYFKSDVPIEITGTFRVGDIRHNVADIAKARTLAGYRPKWTFAEGLRTFLKWAAAQETVDSTFEKSLGELRERGLLGQG